MVEVQGLTNGRTARRPRDDTIIWLVSTREDGRPHAVPVWYHWDGEAVTILSEPDTQKVRNIRHDGRVLLTLDTGDDGDEVDVFEGEATLLDRPAIEIARPELATKYRARIPHLGLTEAEWHAKYHQVIRVRLTHYMGW